MANDGRNPLFIPDTAQRRGPKCPHCEARDFTGRNVGGTYKFTCKACGKHWYGGLPQEPVAPGTVLPPERYVPPVRFSKDSKNQDVEIRRRPDTRPDFKKGALITEDD